MYWKATQQPREWLTHTICSVRYIRFRPVWRACIQSQHQRRARFSIRLFLKYQQNARRILDGAAETKPRIQRNLSNRSLRHITQIDGHQPKASALDEQIRGAQGLVDVVAAHPKELLQHDSRGLRIGRIESVSRIHQRADFPRRGSR